MLIRKKDDLKSSEITPESLYVDRRAFLAAVGIVGVGALAGLAPRAWAAGTTGSQEPQAVGKPFGLQKDDKPTPYTDVTTYNNFYEFGTGKGDPVDEAKGFKPRPWTVQVDGMVAKPATYQLDDFLKPSVVEDRIYRHRCVEAWSMVIPWRGIMLADVLKRAQPTSQAKYAEFTTLYDPKRMPGQQRAVLQWPYTEGLRLDEAMNPLTMVVTGIYGKPLPKQHGAPIRIIVPWKYGYKSIKSIVKIEFVAQQPTTLWETLAPNEYPFESNVNPAVPHPRWSQATERIIDSGDRVKTQPYNGYGSYVAKLYAK